jgi:hypothetical protein
MDLIDGEVSYQANWWVAEHKENMLPGTLRFSPLSGVRLDLMGRFDEAAMQDPLGVMILGEDPYGKLITVYQAFFQSSTGPAIEGRAGSSTFLGNKAFIGAHFNTREETVFQTIAYHPTYLDEWLRLPVIEIKDTLKDFSIHYNSPKPIPLLQNDPLEIQIGFSRAGPDISGSLNSLVFEQHAHFILRKPPSAHFNDYGDALYHLNNFLALAVMAPVYPLDVDAYIPQQSREPAMPIKVLLPLPRHARALDISFIEMLFSYHQVTSELPALIANWFAKRDILEPVYDLFFASTYNPYSTPVQTFLNYAQALETYHRRTCSNQVDPPDVHSSRMGAILEGAPDTHRQWLREKLSWSNEPTFAQRLSDLVDMNPELVTGMVGAHERFIRRVTASRHYYTHYDPSRKKHAESAGALKGLSMVLGSMLEAFIMRETGFDPQFVRERQYHRRNRPDAWL